ncbi:MAG: DUF378 domain-containing protein [Candidatus Magasanikbacteria bacterium]
MKALHMVAFLLVVVGALNWLLVGLFSFDLVTFLFNENLYIIARIVYVLVGLSGLVLLFTHKKDCKECTGQ